jgi:hypothetical protein
VLVRLATTPAMSGFAPWKFLEGQIRTPAGSAEASFALPRLRSLRPGQLSARPLHTALMQYGIFPEQAINRNEHS